MRFTRDDVDRFAVWSGDRNPLHVDSEFARLTHFGRPVVHGILMVLSALQDVRLKPDTTAEDGHVRLKPHSTADDVEIVVSGFSRTSEVVSGFSRTSEVVSGFSRTSVPRLSKASEIGKSGSSPWRS